jgi:hypothetical protein
MILSFMDHIAFFEAEREPTKSEGALQRIENEVTRLLRSTILGFALRKNPKFAFIPPTPIYR